MIRLELAEVLEATGGLVRGGAPTLSVGGVSTDSRSVRPGELFFALSGERFDGHDYVDEALRRGAVGAVVSAERHERVVRALTVEAAGRRPLLIRVDRPLAALARLAAYHRLQHPASVIAVVGSNGKTTTKEMIHHVLKARLKGRASPKSFNNDIGVPLTLLSAEPGDDYLVVEVGTNQPGEIAALGAIVRPDMVVLTCIAEEHLEGLGDLDGVAEEEASMLRFLAPRGFAAVNVDAPQIRAHLPRADAHGPRMTTFGTAEDADLRVTRAVYEAPWLRFTLNGRFDYRLHMPGAHNAANAAGAIAAARRLGFSPEEIAARLESFVPPPMRSEVVSLGDVTLINDAYNANPHSALAALEMLHALARGGRRIAVFGEMRELGEHAAALHRRVAERLREERVDHVLLVGRAAEYMHDALRGGGLFNPTVECCETAEACGERLAALVRSGDVILLKASRAVGLERAVEPLRRRLSEPAVA